jgi:hypothetical protein
LSVRAPSSRGGVSFRTRSGARIGLTLRQCQPSTLGTGVLRPPAGNVDRQHGPRPVRPAADGNDAWIALAWRVGILVVAYAVATGAYRRNSEQQMAPSPRRRALLGATRCAGASRSRVSSRANCLGRVRLSAKRAAVHSGVKSAPRNSPRNATHSASASSWMRCALTAKIRSSRRGRAVRRAKTTGAATHRQPGVSRAEAARQC